MRSVAKRNEHGGSLRSAGGVFAWSVVSFAGSEEGLSERMNVVELNGT